MPVDVNLLREEKGGDVDLVRRSEQQRGRDPATVDAAVAADRCWRESLFRLEQLKKHLNAVNRAIGEHKKKRAGDAAATETPQQNYEEALLAEAAQLKNEELPAIAAAAAAAERRRETLLHRIGNILHPSVPVSLNEDDNAVLRTWGTPMLPPLSDSAAASAAPASAPTAAASATPVNAASGVTLRTTFPLLHHHQILWRIGGVEFRKGVEAAGHRGYYLKGPGFLLNMALVQYGLNFLLRKGYTPVQPPYFLRREAMARAAELKDFEETLYRIPHHSHSAAAPYNRTKERVLNDATAAGKETEKQISSAQREQQQNDIQQRQQHQEERDDLFLIATSEQPLCVLHRGEVLEEQQLPIKYAGFSSCFRKEAGAHGKDCWGLFRIHQFEKVEQFCIAPPSKSWSIFTEMLDVAEEFYQSLELPYRLVAIVSGALNDAAAKKCDIEAWFPAQENYRELVSCSNCTDYQSRALDVRMQPQKPPQQQQGQHQQQEGQREHLQKDEQRKEGQQNGMKQDAKGTGKHQLQPNVKPFVHMLNGTLVATQRCMCCLLENYQTPTGVRVPRALLPYMGGLEFIPYIKAAADEEKDVESASAKGPSYKREG